MPPRWRSVALIYACVLLGLAAGALWLAIRPHVRPDAPQVAKHGAPSVQPRDRPMANGIPQRTTEPQRKPLAGLPAAQSHSPLGPSPGAGHPSGAASRNPNVVFDLHPQAGRSPSKGAGPGTHKTPAPGHTSDRKVLADIAETSARMGVHQRKQRRSLPQNADIADVTARVGVRDSSSDAGHSGAHGKPGARRLAGKPGQYGEPGQNANPGEGGVPGQNAIPGQNIVPGLQTARPKESELAYLNPDPEASLAPWTQRPPDAIRLLEQRLEQKVKGGDNFVTVPIPLIAGQGPGAVKAAVAAHDREAAIVDARLVRAVALRRKGVSFADLCEALTSETGIRFTANRRVADDKVTLFCHPRPLRDIMRLIALHFGFAWVRKGEEGAYEYELTQTLRSQLLEEGLRERDQEEMLLAIDRQMERFRKYRGLSLTQIDGIKKTKDNFGDLFQPADGRPRPDEFVLRALPK